MSFNTFNDDDPNKNSPYNNNPQQPSTGSNPYGNNGNSPYGGNQTPPAQPNSSQGQQPGQGNPYSYQAPPQGGGYQQGGFPQHGQQQGGGFEIMGLTWAKRIVPNPASNGIAPLQQKSVAVSYVLWFFLGVFGVHQFYLGNTSRGLFNLALWGATVVLSLTGIPFSFIFLAYWIYEAVVLSQQVDEVNNGYIRKSIL